LEATGLDVTDIDPVDPKQPPGRKIKTDPTYNVDEVIQTPVSKSRDAEQYYKFIVGKARMGRPLTRAEQDFVKTYQMYRQQKLAEGAADHVRMVMSRAADIMKQRGFRAVGQLSDRDLEQIAQETDATPHDVAIILNIDHAHEQAVAEFAPGAQRDDRGPDEEEILRQYAAQWYNGDEDPRVEKLLATMGWEIGQNEDEAGGAFVIRHGDINGDSFISWTDAELSALNEISDELRRSYLGRAGQQVDRRQTRMAQVRDRLNKGYEIYHAEDPTRIVHRFEADTPQEARRYYERYDADYDSDVDYDLQLRRATGLEENLNELALRSTLPVTQIMNHRSKQIYNLKTQSGEYQIVLDISNKDDNFDDDPDYDGPTGYLLNIYFVGKTPDGSWTQWNTNVGEKQVAQIFATIAQLAVKIIKAHPEIDEIEIKGADPQRSRIYSRLMQQNIDSLLPGWKLGGEGLVREKPQQAVAEGIKQDYLWHGSTQKIPALTPRQAHDTGGAAGSNQNAIYATADKNTAIKMGMAERGSDTAMFDQADQLVLFSGRLRHGKNVYLHQLPRYDANGQDMWLPGGNGNEFYTKPDVKEIKPLRIIPAPVDGHLDLVRKPTAKDLKLRQSYLHQARLKHRGITENTITESAVFLNPNTVIVGQEHGKPLNLSPETLKQIKNIADKHGAWYEGNGADRAYTRGVIDQYVGSFDDEVAKTASPNDPKWIYVLFANVDANNRIQRVGVDPKDTIFNRLLATAKDNSFQGIGFTTQALKKFLAMRRREELDEVKMSPSALEKFATSDAAKGIRAGFEAELIFRDTQGSSDDIDPEPDYDADERAYSISQVIEFFDNDEYGYGLSDRERNRLEENLDESYMQWRDEQIISDFRNDAEDLIREKLLDETPLSERIHLYLTDSEQMSDKEADRIIAAGVDAPKFDTSKEQQAYAAENPYYQAYLDALDAAELELDESVEYSVSQQDGYWDEALDDYRDNWSGDDDSFFSDVGLRWMSDIANEFGLDWPVWNMDNQRNNGSRSWEDIGSELQAVVDMPVVVSDNYHSTSRRPGQWIIEPDGSLHADDQSEEAGLGNSQPTHALADGHRKTQASHRLGQ
jgi:hypothetical protein